MATRQTTDIKRGNYRVMYRNTAAFSVPATTTDWNTLKTSFTEFGYIRRNTLEVSITKGDVEELDSGSELTLGYNLDGKFDLLQTGSAEIAEYNGLDGQALDFLFLDETVNRAFIVKDSIANFFNDLGGQGADVIRCEFTKKNAPSKAAITEMFAIPTS
jgi:hypothetical protein